VKLKAQGNPKIKKSFKMSKSEEDKQLENTIKTLERSDQIHRQFERYGSLPRNRKLKETPSYMMQQIDGNLFDNLQKHGQKQPIIRTKYGIVDGYKREEILKHDISQSFQNSDVSRYIDVEVNGIDEYIALCKALSPVRLKGRDLKIYLNERAEGFLKNGISTDEIVNLLNNLTGVSPQHIRRLLSANYKDMSQSKTASKCSPKKWDNLTAKVEIQSIIKEVNDLYLYKDQHDLNELLEDFYYKFDRISAWVKRIR
jgi:DNA-directed RNA polymerase delta subunit